MPRGERNSLELARHRAGQVSWTRRRSAEILIASSDPLGSIGNDLPHSTRHPDEVDLGDRKRAITNNSDVDLATVDEALHENFVPSLVHRFHSLSQRAHASH